MSHPDLVVVGASAGGVEALSDLVEGLPRDLPMAVVVVLHIPPTGVSRLPEILRRAGPLPARTARHGDAILPGQIYVAPADRHLLVEPNHLRVTRSPRENFHRPAIDPLFRTAAEAYGARAIGVVLSGASNDGASGLAAIKAHGGTAMIQEPGEALFPTMPEAAARLVRADYVLPAGQMGRVIGELAAGRTPARARAALGGFAMKEFPDPFQLDALRGLPSRYGCPECGGALSEIDEDGALRFRCRIGHGYSADALLEGQHRTIEEALAVALRALEENQELALRLAERSRNSGNHRAAEQFEHRAAEAIENANTIRRALQRAGTSPVREVMAVGRRGASGNGHRPAELPALPDLPEAAAEESAAD